MGLLKFLFISILLLYVIRSLARIFLPMIFQGIINKAQQQHNNANQNYQQYRKPEGSIKVDYVPEKQKSKLPDNEGEFIDYEEVK